MRSPTLSILALVGLLVTAGAAHAATFVVDSTADEHDANTADHVCDSTGGSCTLRAAIEQANAESTPTSIVVPDGLYELAIDAPLVIRRDTSVAGVLGGGDSIVDGMLTTHVFEVSEGPTVALSDLVVRNGRPHYPCQELGGGAVCNGWGTTTITRCTFTDNEGYIGAVANLDAGILTIVDSTISGSPSGAIVNTISSLTVRGSTLTGNGSGIHSLGGTATITNSTVSGNGPWTGATGIIAYCPLGLGACTDVRLNNVTVTDGVYAESMGATNSLRVRNSIVAGPCTGTLVSEGYNLLAPSASGCTITGDATGNQIGVDPALAPLADNGGPTATHAIDGTSPAFDAGNPSPPGSGGTSCEATDQRGIPRSESPRCDVGAFEAVCTGGEVCGDGVTQACEQCDDGNTADGDCCSSVCHTDPVGAACTDGDPCTLGDQCSPGGLCTSGPPCDPDCLVCNPGVGCEIPAAPVCAAAPAASATIKLVHKADAAKNRLQWKWKNATPVDVADFGIPGDTRYRLCVYDAAGNVAVSVATGGECGTSSNCWGAKSKGWVYKDAHATVDGLRSITLSAGAAGKAKLAVLGKGAGLALPSLGLPTPVRVRLSRADSGRCWEATFASGLKKNTPELLSGRSE